MDFEWDEIGRGLATLVPVVIFLVINLLFRKQQAQKRRLTTMRSLVSEIDYNQKLVEAFSFRGQLKNFKTGTWKRNKGKLDYLAPDLQNALADAYGIAEGFNREIDAAKKHKSAGYLVNIQADRLSKPLARCQQGLEEWLQLNKGKEKIFRGGPV